MRCSTDIRKRVIAFVASGKSKKEAAEHFQVSWSSVYRWTKKGDISYKKPGPKGPWKIKEEDLAKDLEENQDSTHKERAKRLGVSHFCIWYNLSKRRITRKKNDGLCGAKNYAKKKLPTFAGTL
jgi:excisionase family DNA binding protein